MNRVVEEKIEIMNGNLELMNGTLQVADKFITSEKFTTIDCNNIFKSNPLAVKILFWALISSLGSFTLFLWFLAIFMVVG